MHVANQVNFIVSHLLPYDTNFLEGENHSEFGKL